jgi:hypothetical protein
LKFVKCLFSSKFDNSKLRTSFHPSQCQVLHKIWPLNVSTWVPALRDSQREINIRRLPQYSNRLWNLRGYSQNLLCRPALCSKASVLSFVLYSACGAMGDSDVTAPYIVIHNTCHIVSHIYLSTTQLSMISKLDNTE